MQEQNGWGELHVKARQADHEAVTQLITSGCLHTVRILVCTNVSCGQVLLICDARMYRGGRRCTSPLRFVAFREPPTLLTIPVGSQAAASQGRTPTDRIQTLKVLLEAGPRHRSFSTPEPPQPRGQHHGQGPLWTLCHPLRCARRPSRGGGVPTGSAYHRDQHTTSTRHPHVPGTHLCRSPRPGRSLRMVWWCRNLREGCGHYRQSRRTHERVRCQCSTLFTTATVIHFPHLAFHHCVVFAANEQRRPNGDGTNTIVTKRRVPRAPSESETADEDRPLHLACLGGHTAVVKVSGGIQ